MAVARSNARDIKLKINAVRFSAWFADGYADPPLKRISLCRTGPQTTRAWPIPAQNKVLGL